jgi:hypothetical protein
MLSSGSRISSVAYQLSCFRVGFSLCLITGGLFLYLAPFSWGKVSDPSAGPLLSACCDGLLIIFQFCSAFDFGCCSLAQEMSFVDHYLPSLFQAVTYHPPTVGPSAFPAFVYCKFTWRSTPCPNPLLRCTFSNSVLLLCVNFQFLFIVQFFFLQGGCQSAQGTILVYPRSGCWKIA